jgi:hypothetical protein
MAFARSIAIFTLAVSLLTFIAFFGRLPAFRNTPISFLHRLIVVYIPTTLRRLDVFLTNGRITSGGSRLGHHLMNEKHPVVLVFFLGLITASAALFVPAVWEHISLRHKVLLPLLIPQPYIFTYLSATRNSGAYINELNHAAQMRHYPYDRILYYPGTTCRTCKFLKPARSKHCSICKTCVARADHHCVWVNNCLGRGNYRWFLALLLSTSVLLAYGAYLAYLVLTPLMHSKYTKYEHWYKYKHASPSDSLSWATYGDMKLHYFLTYASIYLDVGGLRASGVGLLTLLTWPLPLGLLLYHLYLIWAGMTTNESSKWADWRDDMADGVVFLGNRREDTMRNDESPTHPIKTEVPLVQTNSGSASSSSLHSPIPTPPESPLDEEEPSTTWLLESCHILIRTLDGKPPRNLPSRIKAVADEDSFKRVWNLSAVENVFDLGFWDNFIEVMK